MSEVTVLPVDQINLGCFLCGIVVGVVLVLVANVLFCLCDLISEKAKSLREKEQK